MGPMSQPVAAADAAFEPQFTEYLRVLFEEQIVFNRLLNLKMLAAGPDWFRAGMEMRPHEALGPQGHQIAEARSRA